MPSPPPSTASTRRLLRRFGRNRRASAAVEFALVAPMFFALLFAIIETALMFFASQVLETVTQNASRQILTGQAQTANYPNLGAFKSSVICTAGNVVNVLFDCTNGISVDVESYSAFSSISIANPIDSNGNFVTTNLGYNPGGPGDIVVVRVFYKWQMFVTGLGYNISNLSGNQRLLVATAAFKNEPY